MNRRNLYILLHILTILCVAVIVNPGLEAQTGISEDSVLVTELLELDTLGLEITGPTNDVAFYLNGLVFLSNSKYHQDMIPDHIAFGQTTSFFTPLEYISMESSRPLFPNDPFPYSPGGVCFSRDYSTVYFTKIVEIPGNRYPEKIFEMSILEGKASLYNQLSFSAGPTRYMHPAISASSDFMVLSSDLAPSNGGLDLFVVRKGKNGWGLPVNLGPEINTSGHEWYPFLDQHNNLFFSSTGHMGYGGYDIYVCFFNGDAWDPPQNLGKIINTEKNETAFSIHPGRQIAIFSADTEEEGQGDEVLRLTLNKSAFVLAGIDPKNQDLSLLLKDMLNSGYTNAQFGAASDSEVTAGAKLTALPLLTEEEPEPEIEESPVQEVKEEEITEPEPIFAAEEESEEAEEEMEPLIGEQPQQTETIAPLPPPEDPDKITFRIQVLSHSKPNTNPTVTIEGKSYKTWEYFYKGAYRITVGAFDSVSEASAFNRKCRSSGFNQSFVAAFRGDERETDPSVFRR